MEECGFSTFEREGWEQLARSYHWYDADLTTQANEALLAAPDESAAAYHASEEVRVPMPPVLASARKRRPAALFRMVARGTASVPCRQTRTHSSRQLRAFLVRVKTSLKVPWHRAPDT